MNAKSIDEIIKGLEGSKLITIHDAVSLRSPMYVSRKDNVEHLDAATENDDKAFEAYAAKIKRMLGDKSAIVAKADATHYDFVNKNFYFYELDFIKQNAKTWVVKTKNGTRGNPVQKNHDLSVESTIGRVLVATPFVYATKSDDINVPNGHIQLIYYITDKDAIEKIADDRFRTLSVSATTSLDQVTCSICGRSVSDTDCMHYRGKIYALEDSNKKELAYWKWKRKNYKEVSYVGNPADAGAEHSAIKFINIDGKDYVDSGDTNENAFKQESAITLMVSSFDNGIFHDLIDVNQKVIQKAEIYTQDSISADDAIAFDNIQSDEQECPACNTQVEEPTTSDAETETKHLTSSDETTAIFHLILDMVITDSISLDDAASFLVNNGLIYINMADRTKEKVIDLLDHELEKRDATLSTKQRKSLRSSQFCGPNRSFPVPDCAHVVAARRLIGRYKGSADTKARILACVNRKAAAMGCDKSKSKDYIIPKEEDTTMKLAFDSVEEMLAAPQVRAAIDAAVTEAEQAKDSIITKANADKEFFTGIAVDTIISIAQRLNKPLVKGLKGKEGKELQDARAEVVKSLTARPLETLKFMLDDYRAEEAEVASSAQTDAADAANNAALLAATTTPVGSTTTQSGSDGVTPPTVPAPAGAPAPVASTTDGTGAAPEDANNGQAQPQDGDENIFSSFTRPVKH